jgi:hypothetical protein
MIRITFIFIWLFCCSGYVLKAQEVINSNVEQALEDLAEADELETEDDSYLQQLSQLRRNRMNLNTATITDLQIFRFLNELLLVQIINYRTLMGPFYPFTSCRPCRVGMWKPYKGFCLMCMLARLPKPLRISGHDSGAGTIAWSFAPNR